MEREVLQPTSKKCLLQTDDTKQIFRQSRVIWPLSRLLTYKTSHGLAFSCSPQICGYTLWNKPGLHVENVDFPPRVSSETRPCVPCCRITTDCGSVQLGTIAAELYRLHCQQGEASPAFPVLLGEVWDLQIPLRGPHDPLQPLVLQDQGLSELQTQEGKVAAVAVVKSWVCAHMVSVAKINE